jgi:hypothetical protein
LGEALQEPNSLSPVICPDEHSEESAAGQNPKDFEFLRGHIFIQTKKRGDESFIYGQPQLNTMHSKIRLNAKNSTLTSSTTTTTTA